MLNNISGTEMIKAYDNQCIQGKKMQSGGARHAVRIPEDKVSLDEKPAETITYGIPPKTEISDAGYTTLRELIVNMLTGQGIATRIATGDTSAAGDTAIDLKDLSPEKAQELISEDGYFGVDHTADRIVQLAISLNGNDPNRLEEIKAGIEKGFEMAANALGGTLPDISMKTWDAVMEKLDARAGGIDAVQA
jgi:hypothetical protein